MSEVEGYRARPAEAPVAEARAPDLDAAVVTAFCRGETAALGTVYDRYARPVWSVSMSVLRNTQLAEDATQETFLRAWRGAGRFDPNRPLGPWLMTIARRTAIDVQRRELRPTRGGHEEEREVPIHLPGIERAWEAWEIRLAIDQLSREEQAIIAMAHFEGLTQAQIAERLDVPIGTIKSRSFRAHKRLAALLDHLIDDGRIVP